MHAASAAPHKGLSFRAVQFMVVGALVAAIMLAIAHGLAKASSPWFQGIFIITLCCVAVGEFAAWHNAAIAWYERTVGSLVMWAVLGIILTGGVLWINYGASAANNDVKASLHKTAFIASEDLGQTERELTTKVKDLRDRSRMKPTRSAEAASAAIAAAKADRFWDITGSCKGEIRGKQSRAFCDKYASAVADRDLSTSLEGIAGAIDKAEADLADVRKRRSSEAAVVSDDQPHLLALASVMGVSATSARQIDAMGVPGLVQAMLVLGGILLAAEKMRNQPRQPWFDRDSWVDRYDTARSLFNGTYERKLREPTLRHTPVHPRDDERSASGMYNTFKDRLSHQCAKRGISPPEVMA